MNAYIIKRKSDNKYLKKSKALSIWSDKIDEARIFKKKQHLVSCMVNSKFSLTQALNEFEIIVMKNEIDSTIAFKDFTEYTKKLYNEQNQIPVYFWPQLKTDGKFANCIKAKNISDAKKEIIENAKLIVEARKLRGGCEFAFETNKFTFITPRLQIDVDYEEFEKIILDNEPQLVPNNSILFYLPKLNK